MNTALDMIHDGDGVAVSGFMLMTVPREIYRAIGERFQQTGHPCGLTLMHGAGNGNNKDQGICEMSYEGLITRYITGHFANNTRMVDLVQPERFRHGTSRRAVISHMYRAAAAGKPGEITRIGLGTFCDPRLEGGKMSEATKEDLVSLVMSWAKSICFIRCRS